MPPGTPSPAALYSESGAGARSARVGGNSLSTGKTRDRRVLRTPLPWIPTLPARSYTAEFWLEAG